MKTSASNVGNQKKKRERERKKIFVQPWTGFIGDKSEKEMIKTSSIEEREREKEIRLY